MTVYIHSGVVQRGDGQCSSGAGKLRPLQLSHAPSLAYMTINSNRYMPAICNTAVVHYNDSMCSYEQEGEDAQQC